MMMMYRHRKRGFIYKMIGLVEFRDPTTLGAAEGEELAVLHPLGASNLEVFIGRHHRYFPEAVLLDSAELQVSREGGRIKSGEPLIAYMSTETGKMWCRPPDEFFDPQRFERIDHTTDDVIDAMRAKFSEIATEHAVESASA